MDPALFSVTKKISGGEVVMDVKEGVVVSVLELINSYKLCLLCCQTMLEV